MNLTPDQYVIKSPTGQTIFQAVKKCLLPVFRLDQLGWIKL